MEKAIKLAIEGGWDSSAMEWHGCQESITHDIWEKAVLSPLFWQALGKSLGWAKSVDEDGDINREPSSWQYRFGNPQWLWYQHKFIDHLAEGKDINSFFEELLK